MRSFEVLSCFSLLVAFSSPSCASSDPSTHPVSVSRNNGPAGFGFSHAANDEYTATLYVNGVPYQLVLDTGSSDTWIDPWSAGVTEPPNLISTGINSTSTYVDGSVSTGPIVLADLELGPYSISNQAIMLSYNGSTNPALYNGILGLGGTSNSGIYSLLHNGSYADNGIPIIYNIFKNQPDLPNYMTWLMSRSEVGISDGGILTISEVLSNMTDIVDAPVFPSIFPGQWTSVMDGIYVNGELITAHTNMSADILSAYNISVPENSVVATFDTGSSFALGPAAFTHAIYKNVPGAQLVPADVGLAGPGQTAYFVPCNTKLNITFSFGGHLYPMHPVDAIDVFQYPNGSFTCYGTILGGTASSTEDMLLGDSFLRNVYQLYDYGTLDARSSPSIRLLSTTDQAQAWAEADALNLARVLAFENQWQATAGAASSTVLPTDRPLFTGSVAAASLTSVADNVSSTPAAAPNSATGIAATSSSLDASATTAAVGADADSVRVAGAVAEDATTQPVDLSTLKTSSYVILGMLAAVLAMLAVVIALLVKVNRANKGYRAVPSGNLAREGKAFEANEESYYATPYGERS